MPTVAYIAPELTAVSETFVFEEVNAIESMGYRVLPFAVRRPEYPARDAQGLAQRTIVLIQGSRWRRVASGLAAAVGLGRPARSSLGMLLSDMRTIGFADARCWRLAGEWLAAARMARTLVRSRVSHIHAHFVDSPTHIAMYASAMTGITFTCTAHANDLFRNGLLLREKAQRARKLLTISHFNRSWLEDQGVDSQQIDVVRCTPQLGFASTSPARLRTGAYRIGALCSLVERKGVDDLLRAVGLLVRSGCAPIRLVIAGEGPERLRLQVLADQLGIHPVVDFIGPVAHAAVAHWMRSLDLFVAACKTDRHGEVDGIPVALMEAMSVGIPVVSTRISGVPELVVADQTGYLAEPADPASLAAQIDRAMAEPERARALGRAARAHVRWEFGREVNLRRLVRHFGEHGSRPTQPAELERAA